MNNWNGIGRATADFELNESGKIASGCIAIDRFGQNEDGTKTTDFINVRFLGEKKAQSASTYIKKGTKVGISGNLFVDKYVDKEGNNRTFAYIKADSWEFAQSKGETPVAPTESAGSATPTTPEKDGFMNIPEGIEDELPFA